MNVKKRGLGRGLNALLGDVAANNSIVINKEKQRSLPVEFLKSGRFQPRKDFDPQKLQELADSISAQGMVQPIIVREMQENFYEIIAGERRWRAAQLAGLHEIPVIIREVSDQSALAIALIENIQREDLNALEEAEALKRLQEEFSLTHQQVADAVGKSRTMVTNLLRINELNPNAKIFLQNGEIEMGHARALLALDFEKQSEVAQKVAAEQLSVRVTEQLIRKLQENVVKKPVEKKDPDIAHLEQSVSEKLGAQVQIKHGKNGIGKLIINYDSLDQLEGVLSRMN